VAASRPAVRAVFAFGPVANVIDYGNYLPPALTQSRSPEEIGLRSPLAWMDQIDVPLYVIEGEQGNADSLEQLKHAGTPSAHFLLVRGATHFTLLAPATGLIAERLMAEAHGGAPFALSAQELVDVVAKHASAH
jgi:hypothetical protein